MKAAFSPSPDHGHDGGRRQGQGRRLEMDDAVHAALSGLTYQLKHAGDESGTHMAAVCERELLARLGLEAGNGAPGPGWGIEPR